MTSNAPQGYSPVDPPVTKKPEDILDWVHKELKNVSSLLSDMQFGRDKMLFVAPKKVYDGLIVLADGYSWNPGSGRGFYGYYSSAWHFLG